VRASFEYSEIGQCLGQKYFRRAIQHEPEGSCLPVLHDQYDGVTEMRIFQ